MQEQILKLIIKDVLQDYNYVEIEELLHEYNDTEEDLGRFCDRFELGNYIYEMFGLADIELSDLLNEEIAQAKELHDDYIRDALDTLDASRGEY